MQQNPAYRVLVRVGLICYGIVHLLIGWLALQVAFGGGGNASQQGALRELARQPFGNVLLLVIGVGLLTLTLWQIIEAATGHTQYDDRKRLRKRITSVAKSVTYAALAVAALRFALGLRGSSGNSGEEATSTLLGLPGGQFLVIALGLAVVGVGVGQVVKGVRQTFTEDLDGGLPQWARSLGTLGYTSKGVAYGVLGVLFVVAALTHDKSRASGLDAALQTLRDQPFGQVLLALVALGFVCFGLFCFVWARHPKQEHD